MADPISKGSCALWLDASVSSSIHATAGAVDTWDDQSGNARNATAATTARPTTGTRTFPTSGLNVLDFDGAANRMTTASFGLSQTFTVSGVLLNDSGANAAQQIWIADITNQRSMNKSTGNKWSMFDGTQLDSSVAADTSGHYFIGVFKAPSLAVISVDGTEVTGNAGSGSWAGGFSIGASNSANWWNGMYAELVIYTVELTAGDRTSLGTYYTNKWFTAPSTVDQTSVLSGFFNTRDW